ncbi:SDR family oxidoreductase [Flammeovirga sp. MY04]|uniref:SDR family oxidoreductase n=1 Tax=Flammeovirga sp. MY04 TaxID=1191459 RepID=UPI0008061418|nr:SDR family oxidoreductase [Flammeovirga sp. MY04]ANQ50874.1 SDR family oxidoreductase [Flammeovirga sp. MY04]
MNVLVTGCSKGIGRFTAEALLKKGDTVIATMRAVKGIKAVEELNVFATQTKGKLIVLPLDVTNQLSIDEAVKNALQLVGNIDVVINNAGVGGTGWTETFTMSQTERMFDVNVFGIQRIMKAILPRMRQKNQGTIINISSIQGRVVFPYSGIYTATKFALEGLTESYHYELKPLGIDVLLVEAGGFSTSFEKTQTGPNDTDRIATYGDLKDLPEKVWGKKGEEKDFLPSPQILANALVQLIETPKEKRKLRTVIDPLLEGLGTLEINATAEKSQLKLSEKLDWNIDQLPEEIKD